MSHMQGAPSQAQHRVTPLVPPTFQQLPSSAVATNRPHLLQEAASVNGHVPRQHKVVVVAAPLQLLRGWGGGGHHQQQQGGNSSSSSTSSCSKLVHVHWPSGGWGQPVTGKGKVQWVGHPSFYCSYSRGAVECIRCQPGLLHPSCTTQPLPPAPGAQGRAPPQCGGPPPPAAAAPHSHCQRHPAAGSRPVHPPQQPRHSLCASAAGSGGSGCAGTPRPG